MRIEQKLKDLIDEKSEKENPIVYLKNTKIMICELKHYLKGGDLSQECIDCYLSELVSYSTITLDIPLTFLETLRARKDKQEIYHIDEISYIKKTTESFPSLGRLNRVGESLFYGSVIFRPSNNDTALKVAMKEVGAENSAFALSSSLKENEECFVRIIGIWSMVHHNNNIYHLSNDVFNYYKFIWSYMKEKFPSNLLKSYKLTDDFFHELLSSKYEDNSRLYNLTSTIANIFFEDKQVDAIIYNSVVYNGEPVITIKPRSIDLKFQHEWVSRVIIDKENYITIDCASIKEDGTLLWGNYIC